MWYANKGVSGFRCGVAGVIPVAPRLMKAIGNEKPNFSERLISEAYLCLSQRGRLPFWGKPRSQESHSKPPASYSRSSMSCGASLAATELGFRRHGCVCQSE